MHAVRLQRERHVRVHVEVMDLLSLRAMLLHERGQARVEPAADHLGAVVGAVAAVVAVEDRRDHDLRLRFEFGELVDETSEVLQAMRADRLRAADRAVVRADVHQDDVGLAAPLEATLQPIHDSIPLWTILVHAHATRMPLVARLLHAFGIGRQRTLVRHAVAGVREHLVERQTVPAVHPRAPRDRIAHRHDAHARVAGARVQLERRLHDRAPSVRCKEAALPAHALPGDTAIGLRTGVERPVVRVTSGRVVAGRERVGVEPHVLPEVDHERHAVRAVELREYVAVEALRGAFALHEPPVGSQHLRALPAERLPAAQERPVADLPAAPAVERRLRGRRTRRRHRQAHIPRLHRFRHRRPCDAHRRTRNHQMFLHLHL